MRHFRSSASAPIRAGSSVSKTILSEADTGSPMQLKEPSYKVVATLDRPDIDANGQKIPLQAGMLLRADILLERRELVRWLLDPILNVRMQDGEPDAEFQWQARAARHHATEA